MKRFAGLLAVIIVAYGIATASLGLCTVLVAGGALVLKFVPSVEADAGAAKVSNAQEFVTLLSTNVFRLAIGALAIAWTVVSVQWFAGT